MNNELLRPWKLITFAIALSFYVWGAYFYRMPTWDVPVSIIMSVLTYLFAPWVVKTFIFLYKERPKQWLRKFLVCVVVTYACASGSYEIYHMTIGIGYHPPTYWPNLYYSTLIFLAAGIFWKFEGSFQELSNLLKDSISKEYKKRPVVFTVTWLAFVIIASIVFYKSLMLDQFSGVVGEAGK